MVGVENPLAYRTKDARRADAVRRAAYVLWKGRGYGQGCADEDWLQAEREVDRALDQRERMIRETAYAHWEHAGRRRGHHLQNWIAAEAEVDAKLERAGGVLEGFYGAS